MRSSRKTCSMPCHRLANQAISIRATDDLSMLQSSVAFVPRFRLLPAPTIRGAIGKQVGNIFSERRLVVLRDEHIGTSPAVYLGTEFVLRMHRIQGHNPPLDQRGRKPRLERADLILLLADIALPEHGSCRHIIATEQMNRMGLPARCAQGFAIKSELGMIEGPLAGLQTTRFASTALLGLPAHEKRREQVIKHLGIDARQHPTIGHLTRHLCPLEPEVCGDVFAPMTNPLGGSPQGGLSCQFGQQEQTQE